VTATPWEQQHDDEDYYYLIASASFAKEPFGGDQGQKEEEYPFEID